MSSIHPTALVEASAQVGNGAEVGPFCIVGAGVVLEAEVRLLSHVVIDGPTRIGARTVVHPFSRLGGPPQDASYRGEPTALEIGPDCLIREHVTMHRGTARGAGVTRVGARGHFMAYAHIGHDAQVGDDVTMANAATLGGHVRIGAGATLGGLSAVHQRCRVGRLAMVGGLAGVVSDMAPFTLAYGHHATLRGLNLVGLRRRGMERASLRRLHAAYAFLFEGDGVFAERIEQAQQRFGEDAFAGELIAFVAAGGERPLMHSGRRWRVGPDSD